MNQLSMAMESLIASNNDSKSYDYLNEGAEFDSAVKSVGEKFFASMKIIIGLVGVIGNLVVGIVVMRLKFQKVHVLITSQAIDDFMCALALLLLTITDISPLRTPTNTGLAYIYCFFWQSHMWLFFVFAVSTYNLIAVSLERYIAVLHPIWYAQNFSNSKAMMFAALAWVIGPIMQIVYAILSTNVQDGVCSYIYYYPDMPNLMSAVGASLFFWEFFIPCVIMGFCFTRIALKLRQQSKLVGVAEVSTVSTMVEGSGAGIGNDARGGNEGASGVPRENNKEPSKTASKRSRNVSTTLIIVFAVYAICWSPDHFLFLQYNLGGHIDFNGWFYGFAVSMAMLNSACNPFIYALRYNQYRKELIAMFTSCKRE